MSMDLKKILEQSRRRAAPYRVDDGKSFKLSRFDPNDTGKLKSEDKPKAKAALAAGIEALAALEGLLYADNHWSVLLIFQAMDAAGKDGAIKHVMSGVNPSGCQVYSFKAPSEEELDHDFLWRTTTRLPQCGHIGVFNRSYYEEVLIVRVHPEILAKEHLPQRLVGKKIWKERFESIRDFERHIVRNGVVVRKFFLNLSKDEQLRRFIARIDNPDKNWKFSDADVDERERWNDYMKAYEDLIRETATPDAPWYVVPADNKWYTRLVVAAAVVDAIGSLDLKYPKLDKARRKQLQASRVALEKQAR